MQTCECGPETSCYTCLRSYSNQLYHEQLSRGAAAEVLRLVLGVAAGTEQHDLVRRERDLELLDGDVAVLVRLAVLNGAPPPLVGWEPEQLQGAMIEAAWPEQKVAVVLEHVVELDAWFAREGWDSRTVGEWSPDLLARALVT